VPGAPMRVLLVEDNPGDARLLREVLADAHPGGYEVQNADCLNEGLRRLEQDDRYDVILLDLSLPDSRGLATVSAIQTAVPDVPIVVLTGTDDDTLGVEAVRIGAQDYLVKGRADGRLLARTIDYATERKRTEKAIRRALDESRERRAEIAALLEAARAVLEHKEFIPAAQAIFTTCKNLLGATVGYVGLLSPDGNQNEVVYLDSGGLPCTVDPSLPMPVRGLRAEAYRTGRVVFNNEFADSEWMRFMPKGHARLDNVLFTPLIVGGKVLGLLGLGNKQGGFTEEDARLSTAFGDLAAVALQNSRMLQSLEASEERFRSVVQTASDAIISIDSGGDVVSWNNAAEAVFGYSAAEMIGRPFIRILPEGFRKAHEQALQRVVATGQAGSVGRMAELVGRRANGREFPLELSLARWKTAEGMFFTGIVRDITERKEAAEALRRMNQELEHRVQERTAELAEKARILEAFFSTAINPVVFLDKDFNFIRVNKAYARACARDVSEFAGRNHFEMYPSELKTEFERVLREKMPWQAFARPFVFPDHPDWGVTYWDLGLVPVLDDRGEVDFLVFSLNDVTARHTAEQARDKLQEQLYQAQKMEAIGQLAAGLGHDFGNLLATVLDHVSRAKESLSGAAATRHSLDAVEEAARQARGIVQSLLTFGCQAGARRRPVNLCAVLAESAYLLRHTLPSSIELVITPAEPPLWVNADPVHMEQILLNLAINARDAMPNGGTLEVSLSSAGEMDEGRSASAPGPHARLGRLVVHDTGAGMPPEIVSRVFDPYFTTKPRGQGTGLGLSIIHGIVEDMGGRIDMDSQVGHGTTVTILLPCIEPPAEPETQADLPLEIPQAQGQLVLLAGGSPYERGVIGATLRLLGCQVLQADNESAMEAFCDDHREKMRLLILVDGAAFVGRAAERVQALRASGIPTPVVIISEEADLEPHWGAETNVLLLRKPFGMPALRKIICDVLGIR